MQKLDTKIIQNNPKVSHHKELSWKLLSKNVLWKSKNVLTYWRAQLNMTIEAPCDVTTAWAEHEMSMLI